jgi:hypothetical protein
MVHVADRLVAASSGPFVLDDPSIEVGDDLLDVLRLTREQLSVVVAALPAAIGEIESVFGPA